MTLNQIARCFGEADGVFAGHPSDEEYAWGLLEHCRKNGISLNNVLDEAEVFLNTKTKDEAHIKKQLAKIKEKFSPWIE